MKSLPSIFAPALLVLSLSVTPVAAAVDQCYECHKSLGDRASTLFRNDVHRAKGISCAGCHGGDPTVDDAERAMSAKAGFVGVPKGDAISTRCASCHADSVRMQTFGSGLPVNQWIRLQQSVHGKQTTYGAGRIAQCTTCHNAHGVASVSNPQSPVHPLKVVGTCARCHSDASYMRSYNPSLPVDQKEKYRTSVHGMLNAKGDAKAAECASCHGSHDILPHTELKSRVYSTNLPGTCATCHSNAEHMKGYKIPINQYEQFAGSVHGVALLQKQDPGAPACNDCHGSHGATPPGVESISKVCGTCHALNADLFAGSPHKKAFDQAGLPECATCHGNHEIITASSTLLGTSPDAVCTRCHDAGRNPAGFGSAGEMRRLMDSLTQAENLAHQVIEEAEQKGMEVAEPKFRLREIRQARLESRTLIHSFDRNRVSETITKGLAVASDVSFAGQEAVDQYYFRRIGLGVATLIITILAIALWIYIRRLPK